jgi:hypothetical protein
MYPTEKQQSENMKSGFEKTGICPLNENIVLKRLPDGNNDSTNDDTGSSKHQVSAALIDMLADMRGVNKDVEIRRRRKKINVAPGKSIGVEDIIEPSTSAGTSTGTATAPDNVDDDVEPDSDVTVNESDNDSCSTGSDDGTTRDEEMDTGNTSHGCPGDVLLPVPSSNGGGKILPKVGKFYLVKFESGKKS